MNVGRAGESNVAHDVAAGLDEAVRVLEGLAAPESEVDVVLEHLDVAERPAVFIRGLRPLDGLLRRGQCLADHTSQLDDDWS